MIYKKKIANLFKFRKHFFDYSFFFSESKTMLFLLINILSSNEIPLKLLKIYYVEFCTLYHINFILSRIYIHIWYWIINLKSIIKLCYSLFDVRYRFIATYFYFIHFFFAFIIINNNSNNKNVRKSNRWTTLPNINTYL